MALLAAMIKSSMAALLALAGNAYVMPAKYRAAYVRDMIERAEAHGFSWSVWSYGGAFGVVDAFDSDRAEPAVMDMITSLH